MVTALKYAFGSKTTRFWMGLSSVNKALLAFHKGRLTLLMFQHQQMEICPLLKVEEVCYIWRSYKLGSEEAKWCNRAPN